MPVARSLNQESANTRSSELEGRAAFGGFIGPRRLVELVRNTAPYLFLDDGPLGAPPSTSGARLDEHGRHPFGWWSILRQKLLPEASDSPTPMQWTDYFALCVACHFASVSTFVPTDVDTKIRDHLWFRGQPPDELERMRELALSLKSWDLRPISARIIDIEDHGPISGHDGERLSILGGAFLGHSKIGDHESALAIEHEIEAELSREAGAFHRLERKRGGERELLILAAAMTHNVGDLDQGFSARGGKRLGLLQKERFGRLAHERPGRFGGAFARAAALYRGIMASEGHRHYPLREIRALRRDPALLLPVGPFFDDWGQALATYPHWSHRERAEVLGGVIHATRKVRGQIGYYRALAGFDRTYSQGIDAPDLASNLGAAAKRELKNPDLRRQVAIRKESFESSLAKRARAILGR